MATTAVERAPAGALRRRWQEVPPSWRAWGRRGLTVAVLGVAAAVAYGRRADISTAAGMLGNAKPPWIVAAVAAEIASMVVFARLQRWLLRSGGVRVPLLTMVEIVMAGNALSSSLPGGPAWSATWAFGQLRRRGADRVLAGWVILVAGALASFSVFVIVAVGAWVAGPSGPASGLRWAAAALAAIPALAAGAYVWSRNSPGVRRALRRAWSYVATRVPGAGKLGVQAGHVTERLATVRPGVTGWIEAFALAMANWLYDAACLVFCIEALGIPVPWRAVLVIYGLTQVSASLPITPGGLGVVEGSLAALLVGYGVSATNALAAVLLYRIVSFWGLVPVGWLTWFGFELAHRSGIRRRTHPWAEHRHGESQRPEPAPVGPERILRPAPCRDCPDRPVDVSESVQGVAS